MLMTEYDEEMIRKYDRKEGEEIGKKNGADLMNWLWENGRGNEAKEAANNSDVFERLHAEYIAANNLN